MASLVIKLKVIEYNSDYDNYLFHINACNII